MIGRGCAAGRVLLGAILLFCLVAAPVSATPSPQSGLLLQRAAFAVSQAQAMRKRGQKVWCVPFARMASGIEIKGNAVTWWAGAAGRYDRGDEPAVGAVMAFGATRKMRMGHVAVVSRVISDRVVQIDHANWTRNQISLNMTVVDVSAAGDWSAVRVESQPGVLGAVYPVKGFIYPNAVMASE
jgi:surface antigen